MSIESRIRNLENFFDPGSNKRVEQECQERMRFAITLLAWEPCDDLPEAWRLALTQAIQALHALPPLPKHQCAPKRPLTDEEKDRLRWLVAQTLNQRWSCRGTVELDKETLELWTRFAPNVPIPAQRETGT